MATNERSLRSSGQDDPYVGAVAVDVSGGNQTLATSCRGVFVGGAGNLAVTMLDGSQVTLTGIAAGSVLRLCVVTFRQTGTTATNVTALL